MSVLQGKLHLIFDPKLRHVGRREREALNFLLTEEYIAYKNKFVVQEMHYYTYDVLLLEK